MAHVGTKWGTSQKRSSSGPISTTSVGAYSTRSNAFSMRSSLPQAPTTRRKVSRAPAGA
jgi:hypothetical protein